MALTVIDEPTLGGRLGAAVGGGLSGLMQNLVQKKAQELERNKRAMGYEQGFGLDKQAAQMLAGAPDDFQQVAIKSLIEAQQNEQLQRQLHPEMFSSNGMNALNAMGSMPSSQPSLEGAMQAFGGSQQEPADAIQRALQKGLQQEQVGKPAPIPNRPSEAFGQAAAQQEQGKQLGEVFKNRPLNPQLALKAEEINTKKEATAERSKEKAYEYNKETISKARESAKRAEQDNHTIEQVLKANASGKLYQGPTRKLLEKLGLEDIITNTPTQFVAKQIERFVTGAPSKFGTSRFTNFLAESYQKGNLRLVNSKEAMDLIGKGIMLENDKEKAYYAAMRDIEKESQKQNRPIPYDLADQALERARPKMEALDIQATQNLENMLQGDKKSSFNSLPAAKDYNGKSITDTKTGVKYKSNGSKWVKA
jgi:hypothetical protein